MDWNEKFMGLAEHVATWSKDPSTKVGAVIADINNHVVGLGYNGFPRFVGDHPERYEDRETKYKIVVHAEANAILNAVSDVYGNALYVTHPPCNECAKLIIQSGLRTVYTRTPNEAFMQRFSESFKWTKLMFDEADIPIIYVKEKWRQ